MTYRFNLFYLFVYCLIQYSYDVVSKHLNYLYVKLYLVGHPNKNSNKKSLYNRIIQFSLKAQIVQQTSNIIFISFAKQKILTNHSTKIRLRAISKY